MVIQSVGDTMTKCLSGFIKNFVDEMVTSSLFFREEGKIYARYDRIEFDLEEECNAKIRFYYKDEVVLEKCFNHSGKLGKITLNDMKGGIEFKLSEN